MTDRLPLFPLGTVLYPGLLLPLHVFEDRYRALVADLSARPEPDRAFGVVAIREGREVGADGVRALHAVGCLAQVREVSPHPDGRYDLVTAGTRRFRIGDLDGSTRPYLQADVEMLDEPAGDAAAVLARSVATVWSDYRRRLAGDTSATGDRDRSEHDESGELGDLGDADELAADPTALSYLVAAATVLDLSDKQRLLEEPDTTGRLRRELAILRREAAMLRLLPSLPAVDLTRTQVSAN